MGVAWVFETDKASQAIERILEAGGADLNGHYSVDSVSYRPIDQLAQNLGHLCVLHHSHFPQSTFAVAPGENFKASPRAVCDRGFDMILSKLSSGLKADESGKFEVNGSEFSLHDFTVRVGTATLGGSIRGVIVEVEYAPSWVASQSALLLTEFMAMFFPDNADKKPDVVNKASPEPYTALDTLYQYQQIFNIMRRRA